MMFSIAASVALLAVMIAIMWYTNQSVDEEGPWYVIPNDDNTEARTVYIENRLYETLDVRWKITRGYREKMRLIDPHVEETTIQWMHNLSLQPRSGVGHLTYVGHQLRILTQGKSPRVLVEYVILDKMEKYIIIHENGLIEFTNIWTPSPYAKQVKQPRTQRSSIVEWFARMPVGWGFAIWMLLVPLLNTIACCCVCHKTESFEYLL